MSIVRDLEALTTFGEQLEGPLLDEIVAAAGDDVADELRTAGARVAGGDLTPSRLGERLGIAMTGAAGGTLTVQLTGPWSLLFGGAAPHLIPGSPHPRAGTRVLAFRTARGGSRVRTGPVRHPGTRGDPGLDRAVARIPDHLDEATDAVLRREIG